MMAHTSHQSKDKRINYLRRALGSKSSIGSGLNNGREKATKWPFFSTNFYLE